MGKYDISSYYSFETLLDAVEYEAIYHLDIGGVFPHKLEELRDDKATLQPPILPHQTSTCLEVGSDNISSLPVPSNQHHSLSNLVANLVNDGPGISGFQGHNEFQPIKTKAHFPSNMKENYKPFMLDF